MREFRARRINQSRITREPDRQDSAIALREPRAGYLGVRRQFIPDGGDASPLIVFEKKGLRVPPEARKMSRGRDSSSPETPAARNYRAGLLP